MEELVGISTEKNKPQKKNKTKFIGLKPTIPKKRKKNTAWAARQYIVDMTQEIIS